MLIPNPKNPTSRDRPKRQTLTRKSFGGGGIANSTVTIELNEKNSAPFKVWAYWMSWVGQWLFPRYSELRSGCGSITIGPANILGH